MRRLSLPWGRRVAFGFATAMLCIAWGAPARAQVGGSATLDSDYRFRGVSLSDSRPSLRLTLNVDGAAGWYAGASATRVSLVRDQHYEQLLGYAGFVTSTGPGPQFEFGASASHFTGDSSQAGDGRYDYVEPYVGVLGERWSARVYYAPNYFGRHVQTAYAELDAHTLLTEQWRLFGHAGAIASLSGTQGGTQSGTQSGTQESARRTRADIRVGTGLALHDWDLQIAWVAAQRGGPYPVVFSGHRSAWVAGVSYAF
jgi:uncharacterized protein (TIGR02001 family)